MKPTETVNVRRSSRQTRKPGKSTTGDEYDVVPPILKENQRTKRKIQPGGLSICELQRLENIRQNQEFLSSIKLLQAKQDLKLGTLQRAIRKQNKIQWSELLPPRTKSLRIQKIKAEKLLLEPHGTYSKATQVKCLRKPDGPITMEAVNMEEGSPLPYELLELWSENSIEVEKEELDLKVYRSNLKNMELSEIGGAAKVVKNRIFSSAFHPCSSRLLMAAGDKSGGVALWNLDSAMGNNGVLQFEPHTKPVACMAFSTSRPTELLTLSYDGTLRSTDVKRAVFDEVYRIKNALRTFDFLSDDSLTLVAGDWYGDIAIVDRRTPGTSHESIYSLDTTTVCCVHVHPVQKQYVMVAENSIVSIYDVRCLKESSCKPVTQLLGHSDSISSAYFSPGTGNRVLTSCLDDSIRIFDASKLISNAPLLTSIK
ncbi:hypothetical protein DPEC_G00253620 [Dallia pectoralis]|uniref:Uncharacterized protein n=1 Tax=Dallia pectoralis TaxID=75939 RepID=A0ACC2FTQ5_DALPE|nr:hypothetical protein DPEC_G00253620 [Dallia pectoralis]